MATFNGHLHTHTEYSVLDGLSTIEGLILKAKSLGQDYVAITDHGTSSGLYEAGKMADKHDFHVIFGEEFYFENDFEPKKNGHLIILAKNQMGLENLFTLQKLANKNKYYKPRLNFEMLEQHHEGLICTSACIANIGNQHVLRGEYDLALLHFKRLEKIFGEDFYLEVQSSTLEDVITCNKFIVQHALNQMRKPQLIVTNDVHYVEKEDYKTHEILLCIQQQGRMADPKRWKFETNDFWMKDQKEMERELSYVTRDVINLAYLSGNDIASKCDKSLRLESGHFIPRYSDREPDVLASLTAQKYAERIKPLGEASASFWSDCEKELEVIKNEGYSGYYLIVQDFINHAKANGILVGDGRGSGAGSKVAYTIGITEINPSHYGLLFERFLSPGRAPDLLQSRAA